jgi:hypothetical protein
LRCRDMAALQYCCNAAKSTLLHVAMLPGLHVTLPGLSVACYNTARSALLHAATLRHCSTTGLYFCVVGSRPWHYPLLKRYLPNGAGLLGYRWWNRLTKSWAWTRFLACSQVGSKGG